MIDERVLLTKLDNAIDGFRKRKMAAFERRDIEHGNLQYTIEVALWNIRDAIAEACKP